MKGDSTVEKPLISVEPVKTEKAADTESINKVNGETLPDNVVFLRRFAADSRKPSTLTEESARAFEGLLKWAESDQKENV